MAVALALIAAFLFGAMSVAMRRGLADVEAGLGLIISLATTTTIFVLAAPWFMRWDAWFSPGWWVFALGGLIHPLISMYLSLEATHRAGATIAATFASTAPLFAALTAIAFLGERISGLVAAGTAATVLGIMTISWGPIGAQRLVRIALLLATGTAVVRGLNHTIGKWGLELLPSVYMAATISFMVSLAGAVTVYRLRTGAFPRPTRGPGAGIFVATGALMTAAILCMYSALASGQVVVVSPLVNTYPLFTLLVAVACRQEIFTSKLAAGVIFVVAGVTLIGVDSAL